MQLCNSLSILWHCLFLEWGHKNWTWLSNWIELNLPIYPIRFLCFHIIIRHPFFSIWRDPFGTFSMSGLVVFPAFFNLSLNFAVRSSWSEPVSSQSCFCWLYRASPSSASKNIINLISVLTIWWSSKLSSGHRTGKGQFSFQSQRKEMPKNAQTTAPLHSSHMLVK